MSVAVNEDTLQSLAQHSLLHQGRDDNQQTLSNSCNNSPSKKNPPPVLPKTFRSPNTNGLTKQEDQNNQSSVYICVTQEKETELEAKYRQMELELKTNKLERDMFHQDILRLKSELQETQKEIKKAHNKIDRYNMVSKSKKVSLKIFSNVQIFSHNY